MSDLITIAMPTGRLGKETLKRFKQAGMLQTYQKDSRKLVVIDHASKVRFLFVKPVDVITYVVNKVADLGVVGKDQLLEEEADVYELLELGFGQCKLAVAGFENTALQRQNGVLSIATKYPNITKRYFQMKNQSIELIPLSGSVELAPLVGLSDCIVDIVETGNTLKENGLSVLEEMMDISARLIANRVSYRFKNALIDDVIQKLKRSKEELS